MPRVSGKVSTVLFSPHLHSKFSLHFAMWNVVIALLPAGIAGVYYFGLPALRIIIISVITALITELLMNLMTKSKITIFDGSALITGLLFAYNLPPAAPWYLVIVGSFFAIALVKWAFGGLGYNFMNPALGGRIFVIIAWSNIMVGHWSYPVQKFIEKGLNFVLASQKIISPDGITGATPLTVLKAGGFDAIKNANFDYWSLFVGNIPGCIGETSKIAILVGGIYLLALRIIQWEIPVIYIGTVAFLSWLLGGLPFGRGIFTGDPLFHILSGGLFLGAFFMATDYVTSPISFRGRIVFAIMLGILTVVIRLFGGYPEGVSYAIVIMNIFVPLIDRYLKDRIYGYRKGGSNA
ncbi:MAG: RnfABCDGE type electron transport complex subunit D [Brevinematia bacterium]